MGAKDYFDLLMHGGPWLVLIGMGAWDLGKYLKKKRER
jgi:hypothetical protein